MVQKCSNRNTQERQHKQSIERKKLFIHKKGGKCIKCGYKKHMSGLTFHHQNPDDKKMTLDARSLGNFSLNKCLDELNKCDLICANCHNELHNPQFDGLI